MGPRYINVTDGQTDGRLTIAIPRFALRASRGKNGRDIRFRAFVEDGCHRTGQFNALK